MDTLSRKTTNDPFMVERDLSELLFTRTLLHSEWRSLVSWASIEWLASLANPQPLENTTTSCTVRTSY